MAEGRVGFGTWALKVLTWDAVLPACVVFIPMGVQLLLPGRRGAIEITAVILPIAALFLRFRAGKRHIDSNRCSRRGKLIQLSVFCLGILPLVLTDCFFILSELMPRGALIAHRRDQIALAVLFSIYLVAMIVAMYPGRTETPPAPDDFLTHRNPWAEGG
jgi:hypothetical protein